MAALRLEDADRLALTFDGAALGVNGFKVLIEEDDGGGVFGVIGGGMFCGVKTPLRHGRFAEPTGETGRGSR
jgi:hypothetical protein